MARIVMKFGGTSMAGTERIRRVARIVQRQQAAGHEVAVVVSAMAGETDRLVNFCREADALYEEYIKDARAKAEEAYAALESGTSFTDVMADYGEDTIYTSTPSFVDTGLLMYLAGEDTTWDAKLTAAVGLLKAGEYSPTAFE